MTIGPPPRWMEHWPWSAPQPTGAWTIGNGTDFALLDPESGTIRRINPADDPELPGIATACASGGRLVSYRHRRRAVTRHPGHYTKIVRTSRVDAVVQRHRDLHRNGAFETPGVIDSSEDGLIRLGVVQGTPLHDRMRAGAEPPIDRIVASLAALHRLTPSTASSGSAVIDEPSRWIAIVCRMEPEARTELEQISSTLRCIDVRADALVHTDLHDKNIILTRSGIGLIDLDSTSTGAPELDVANLAVHLELRSMQAGDASSVGRRRADGLVSAYQRHRRLDAELLDALERHAWFRLACLYRCRRAGRAHVEAMLMRAGSCRSDRPVS